MKILIAPDSFKESISAENAAFAIKKGILKRFPAAEITCLPLADGGEGTAETIVSATAGIRIFTETEDALGNQINTFYGLINNETTAVIELATASGLAIIPEGKRNPLLTSTYGTGILIKSALEKGIRRFIICLGGSATNDAGAGLMQALGLSLMNINGQETVKGGAALKSVSRINSDNLLPQLPHCSFTIACDVTNPLTGETGATRVFAPQKGATQEMILQLETAIEHYADIVKKFTRKDLRNLPGAGAAGGTAFSLLNFLNAEMRPGFEVVAEATDLRKKISTADLIITGEGKLDQQTLYGKVVSGVAAAALLFKKEVYAIAGTCELTDFETRKMGINKLFMLQNIACSRTESIQNAALWLEKTGEIIGEELTKKSF